MFENKIAKTARPEGLEVKQVDIIGNPYINSNVLKCKMESIDTMEDDELYNIIKETYPAILEDIFKRRDKDYLITFTTPKFLTTLIRVLQQSASISCDHRVYCNKLAYDYMTMGGHDKYIKELFFSLSKIVNRDVLPGLLGLGIDENLASYLALARYSTMDDKINIMRVNTILINLDPDVVHEDLIIKIYGKLFDRLSVLFETIMFSIVDIEDEDEISEEQEKILEMNSVINLAILDILDTQPIDIITAVLTSYASDFQLIHKSDTSKIRFSLRRISNDYARVRYTVELLESDGIFVP